MFLFSKYFVSKKRYDRGCAMRCMAVDHTVTQNTLIKKYKDIVYTNNIEYQEMKSNLNILKDNIKNQQNQIHKLQKDDKETCNEYQKHSDKQNEKIIKLKKNLKDNVEIYMRNTKKLEDQIQNQKETINRSWNIENELIGENKELLKSLTGTNWIENILISAILFNIVITILNIVL